MKEKKFSIGIDIGGTNTVLGLVDAEGQILDKQTIKTKDSVSFDHFITALTEKINQIATKASKNNLLGIGIGAPNANYFTGTIDHAANLPWKGSLDLRNQVQLATGFQTIITNDANAAAIGEMIYGNAKNEKNFILLTLGTGVGSGIVANGQLIYGHDSLAGEIGHMIAVRDGRECGCGRNGCLETYTSASGVARTIREYLENEPSNPNLPNGYLVNLQKGKENLNTKDLHDAAKIGDPLALKIFEETGEILGRILADVCAITNPKLIILFGGLSLAEDFIIQPTQKSLDKHLLSIYKNKVKIILSALNHHNAAILGAASLIFAEN